MGKRYRKMAKKARTPAGSRSGTVATWLIVGSSCAPEGIEMFKRVKGYREIPKLVAAL